MEKEEKDTVVALVDEIYSKLPRTLDGENMDADFNDDGTIQVSVGGRKYVIEVRSEE